MRYAMLSKTIVAVLGATRVSFAATLNKKDPLDSGGCTRTQRQQINTAIRSASSVAAAIDGNHDQSDWDT